MLTITAESIVRTRFIRDTKGVIRETTGTELHVGIDA